MEQTVVFGGEIQEKLRHISNKLAYMYTRGVDDRELGFTALEIVVARNAVEEILEGNRPRAEKKFATEISKRIRELEKSLISLYAIGRLKGEKWVDVPFINYIMRGYGKYYPEPTK